MNNANNAELPANINSEQELQILRERVKQLEQGQQGGESIEAAEQVADQHEMSKSQPTMPVINDDQVLSQTTLSDDQKNTDDNIGDDQDLSNQIKHLVKVALTEGLEKSIDSAIKLKNPYIVDELHDTLVDHLYDELIRMKKIEKD